MLVGEKRAAHAFDGGRHRRKIDDDLVGKPSPLVADLVSAAHRNRMFAEATKGVPRHELLLR